MSSMKFSYKYIVFLERMGKLAAYGNEFSIAGADWLEHVFLVKNPCEVAESYFGF
jgi:hypothetical protein